MKFRVYFIAQGWGYSAIYVPERETTLRDLLRIRKELNLAKFPEERVVSKVEKVESKGLSIVIPSSLILSNERLTSLFMDRQSIDVSVPNCGLNRFITTVIETDKDNETGEIKKARLKVVLTEEGEKKILEEWIAAGCPLEWDPRKENDSKNEDENENEDEEYDEDDEDEYEDEDEE